MFLGIHRLLHKANHTQHPHTGAPWDIIGYAELQQDPNGHYTCPRRAAVYGDAMFCVDEVTSEAIRRAFHEEGELSAIIELRRHFPLITGNARGRECVRIIAGWRPVSLPAQAESKVVRLKSRRPLTPASR